MSTSVTMTRRQLYDLVWSKPMRDLAGEFGLSDVGLAKICRRHRVPVPGRRYWARQQAGQKQKPALFVEVDDSRIQSVRIHGPLSRLSEAARDAIRSAKAARTEAKKTKAKSTATVSLDTDSAASELHPIIRRTAQVLRKAKVDSSGGVRAVGDGLCGVEVSSTKVERAIALLNALVLGLAAKDLSPQPTGKGVIVAIAPDSAEFTMKERTRWEKHIPTAEELAAQERRQKRSNRTSSYAWSDSGLSYYGRSYPEKDLAYSGQFVLQVEGWADGVRRKWADGKKQTVESLLDDIVLGIVTLLAVRKASRERREEQDRQWQERARRRELENRRVEREQSRRTYLAQVIAIETEISELRQWLARQKVATVNHLETNFGRLVAWAGQRLADLEATVSQENLEEDLASKPMFPFPHDPLELEPVK